MAKRNSSDSEHEEESAEASGSEEEEEEEGNEKPIKQDSGITEYEKQRLSRIAENKARMEALGLRKMASSLMGTSRNSKVSSGKDKGKRKVRKQDEDEEYKPNDDDDDDDGMDVDDDDDDDDDEDFVASKSRRKTVKNKIPTPKKKASAPKKMSKSDHNDEDEELMQAIALSLQDSAKAPGVVPRAEKKGNSSKEDTGTKKRKKSFASRVQMTEDELIIHFFQFDEAGKGTITVRDLERMAIAHDFTWTDKELADMIHCFDSDRDGKLNLDDFRNIVSRCNMIQEPGSSM